jgi:hypothetical protein
VRSPGIRAALARRWARYVARRAALGGRGVGACPARPSPSARLSAARDSALPAVGHAPVDNQVGGEVLVAILARRKRRHPAVRIAARKRRLSRQPPPAASGPIMGDPDVSGHRGGLPGVVSPVEELMKLADMLEKGLLTCDEFDFMKARLMGLQE